jgi:hypothetical protein
VEEGDDIKGFVLELLAINCSILSLSSYRAKHIADPRSHRLHVHCKGGEALGGLSRSKLQYLEPTSWIRTGLASPGSHTIVDPTG